MSISDDYLPFLVLNALHGWGQVLSMPTTVMPKNTACLHGLYGYSPQRVPRLPPESLLGVANLRFLHLTEVLLGE